MKIILGLGNPGPDYKLTRHNCGVMLVDKIYELRFGNDEYGFRRNKDIFVYKTEDLILAKSANVFMNESGRMIHDLKYMNYDMKNLYLVHDDLDIKLGEYKIQFGRGPKEHGGVNSVEEAMGTDQFWRVRIGVENRNTPISGEEYVLQRFPAEEKAVVDETMMRAMKEL